MYSVVPPGGNTVHVWMWGAGGAGGKNGHGGGGAYAHGTFNYNPGDTIEVYVGQGGWWWGYGGGFSAVRPANTPAGTEHFYLIAAGGGGGGSDGSSGSAGAGANGGAGGSSSGQSGSSFSRRTSWSMIGDTYGGQGGTQSGGGAGGGFTSLYPPSDPNEGCNGGNGAKYKGGNSQFISSHYLTGSLACRGQNSGNAYYMGEYGANMQLAGGGDGNGNGGGGGAGYYGGGAGGGIPTYIGAGGGGGSSYSHYYVSGSSTQGGSYRTPGNSGHSARPSDAAFGGIRNADKWFLSDTHGGNGFVRLMFVQVG